MKALHLTRPHAIMLVGLPGSGKSFFATQFSKTFSTPYLDVSEVQKYAQNVEDAESLTLLFLKELIKTSQTFLFEGNSISRARRTEFAKWARAHDYQPLFVWIQTDPNTSFSRARKAKAITIEEFEAYQQRFSSPHPDENPVVISGRHTYAMQVKVVLSQIGNDNRKNIPAAPPAPRTNTRTPSAVRSITVR